MAHRIVASFPSLESSFAAEAHLRAAGFTFTRQHSLYDAAYTTTAATNRLSEDPVQQPDRQNSEWIIAVDAVFGRAEQAIHILRTAGAVSVSEEAERPARVRTARTDDDAEAYAPLHAQPIGPDESFFVSSALGIPLLVNCPAPLSSLLRLPTLIRERD